MMAGVSPFVLFLVALVLFGLGFLLGLPVDSPARRGLFMASAATGLVGLIRLLRTRRMETVQTASPAPGSDRRDGQGARSAPDRTPWERFGSQAALDAVVELVRSGQKIEAIKMTREITGLGLKEAKDLVDQIEGHLRRGDHSRADRS